MNTIWVIKNAYKKENKDSEIGIQIKKAENFLANQNHSLGSIWKSISRISVHWSEESTGTTTTTPTPFNYQTHPGTIYTSQLLNYSRLPKPKNEENFEKELEELTKSTSALNVSSPFQIQKKKMIFKFFDKLSQDFSELLDDKEENNVMVLIVVDKEQNKQSFTAHSAILRYRSSYFNKELSNLITLDGDNTNIKTITLQNISAQLFEVILKYIYGGIINTDNMDTKTIFKLMIVANELEFEELSERLENHFVESKAPWLRTYFTFVYNSSFENNKLKNLEKFRNDTIAKYPNLIFESAEFTSIRESALVSILKLNDLQVKESEIWDHVIKWGTAQNSTLPEKLEEWSDENFITLKTTLQQCLPLIRYFQISNSDVMEKVEPYNKILDEQLWNDLKQHLTLPDRPIKSIVLPPRVIELFSTILNEEQAVMISSWIDHRRVNYSSINNPYEFRLILRGSKDGFSPRTFWNVCDGYVNTIVVAKVKGTDEIVGGFNPLAWDKKTTEWKKTNKSFIFSFKEGYIQNSILSRVKDKDYALFYHYISDCYGPKFGGDEFRLESWVNDFTLDKQSVCSSAFFNHYEKPIRSTSEKFSITDYEVFTVITKSSCSIS
ncbi:hypothetical protein Glove_230g156 [Diversispora epigaea]|uniref:BTB domain-containing protein n=1 Tax=Diversispora epigaea TaxID=1348612 RepID=A0A397IH08_9GLOM|nr:hypothetical protein Glove_230g156 [Diversispora epigaea]